MGCGATAGRQTTLGRPLSGWPTTPRVCGCTPVALCAIGVVFFVCVGGVPLSGRPAAVCPAQRRPAAKHRLGPPHLPAPARSPARLRLGAAGAGCRGGGGGHRGHHRQRVPAQVGGAGWQVGAWRLPCKPSRKAAPAGALARAPSFFPPPCPAGPSSGTGGTAGRRTTNSTSLTWRRQVEGGSEWGSRSWCGAAPVLPLHDAPTLRPLLSLRVCRSCRACTGSPLRP